MLSAMIFAACVMATVLGPAGLAQAQVSVDIGIHLGSPPQLVAVPSSPVMYAPAVTGNFFFYAGQYYVYRRGAWYAGPRHDGPWAVVRPEFVPRPILSVPVKYYRVPPPEWKRWHAEAAPRWQPTYGRRWEEHPAAMREEHREEHREMRRGEERR
jgi:hypothetical protein